MITITCPSLDELTKKLNSMGKELPATYDKVLNSLCEEAVGYARAGFRGAKLDMAADDYHFKDEQVTKEKVDECDYLIRAEGDDICFLEFGSGYGVDNGHEWAVEMPFQVFPGSWSVGDSQQFAMRGYWYSPSGHYYKSIPATRAMFNASEMLRTHLENGDFPSDL